MTKLKRIGLAACAMLIACAPALAQRASGPTAPASQKPAFFERQGIKVLAELPGVGGLHVWQVERNGLKTVLYTTPDNKVLLSGVLWDATSGKNLSDAYITPEMVQSAPSAPTAQAAAEPTPRAKSSGPSEALKAISALTGIKEGNAAVDKTLYIIFDPRCPHCHAAYMKTRKYVANGGSIKWLPSTVLGNGGDGAKLIADILQSKDPRMAMATVMGKTSGGTSTPSPQTMHAIGENEAYFWASFDQNKGAGVAGVPVAYFETQDGSPQMVAGIDDDALLQRILTDIKK